MFWQFSRFLALLALGAIFASCTAEQEAVSAGGAEQALARNQSCVKRNLGEQAMFWATWSGDCVNGLAQGWGTQNLRHLEDGEWQVFEYTGEMKDDKWHGHGVLVAYGDRYEGDWKDNNKHGRGVLVTEDGTRYEGDWKDDKRHGHGVVVTADGRRYEGGWQDGKRHGRGVLTTEDGTRYEGGWMYDKAHGRAVILIGGEGKYEGEFRYGKPQGPAVLTLGDRFECRVDWGDDWMLNLLEVWQREIREKCGVDAFEVDLVS